jgi:hypothetical protein
MVRARRAAGPTRGGRPRAQMTTGRAREPRSTAIAANASRPAAAQRARRWARASSNVPRALSKDTGLRLRRCHSRCSGGARDRRSGWNIHHGHDRPCVARSPFAYALS